MSQWSHILTAVEIEAFHVRTAKLDPAYAASERKFYQSRTVNELKALAAQAFDCDTPTGYQLAKSYLALQVQS